MSKVTSPSQVTVGRICVAKQIVDVAEVIYVA